MADAMTRKLVQEIVNMGHMKTFWIFGFEWWGGLRPAWMKTKDGHKFVPLALGVWIRSNL